MELKEVIIVLGGGLCFISVLLLTGIQLGKAAKSGIYVSVLEPLNKQEISKAKLSGALFLGGAIIIFIGIAL